MYAKQCQSRLEVKLVKQIQFVEYEIVIAISLKVYVLAVRIQTILCNIICL